MTMRKKALGEKVIKLLKQGYTPKEITQRMAVSYNYAWKLWTDMKKQAEAEAKTVVAAVQEAVQGLKPGEFVEADTNVDATLDERAATYGNFMNTARIAQRLKNVAHNFASETEKRFDVDQAEALDMIFTKIGRILNGDPYHIDSWLDIAGYATLVADRLEGRSR